MTEDKLIARARVATMEWAGDDIAKLHSPWGAGYLAAIRATQADLDAMKSENARLREAAEALLNDVDAPLGTVRFKGTTTEAMQIATGRMAAVLLKHIPTLRAALTTGAPS